MEHQPSKILVWSQLGVFSSLGTMLVSLLLFIGIETEIRTWGPAQICIFGDGPGPQLSEKQLHGYTEGHVLLFGRVIRVYDLNQHEDFYAYLGLGAGGIFVLVTIVFIVSVRIYRHAYQLQFIEVV